MAFSVNDSSNKLLFPDPVVAYLARGRSAADPPEDRVAIQLNRGGSGDGEKIIRDIDLEAGARPIAAKLLAEDDDEIIRLPGARLVKNRSDLSEGAKFDLPDDIETLGTMGGPLIIPGETISTGWAANATT